MTPAGRFVARRRIVSLAPPPMAGSDRVNGDHP